MKIAFATSALLFCSLTNYVYADSDSSVLNTHFEGQFEKFKDAIHKLFSKFDDDGDGFITGREFNRSIPLTPVVRALIPKPDESHDRAKTLLFEFDTNQDQKVSFDEFLDGITPYASRTITANPGICDEAKDIVKKCGVKSLSVSLERALCKIGASGLRKYPVESCILANRNDCSAVEKCYSSDFRKEQQQQQQRKDLLPSRRLEKRLTVSGWKAVYWTSMIILGIFALGSIIGIPFFVFVVYISAQTIDFSKMN